MHANLKTWKPENQFANLKAWKPENQESTNIITKPKAFPHLTTADEDDGLLATEYFLMPLAFPLFGLDSTYDSSKVNMCYLLHIISLNDVVLIIYLHA